MSCSNRIKWRSAGLGVFLALTLFCSGCTDKQTASQTAAVSSPEPIEALDAAEMFTDRDWETGYDNTSAVTIFLQDGASVSSSYEAVSIEKDTITIRDEGTYIVTGALSNGQLVVEAEETDKLQLVLKGTDICCDTSAAIYIKKAEKVFITLAADTKSVLSHSGEYTNIDENNIDSVIFSKEDLTLNGSGCLVIEDGSGHGIVSKDDLVITGGEYHITATGHGLAGKDSIRIADGIFTVLSGKDGLHAENADDALKGFLYIENGDFTITSGDDGLDSSCTLQINAGSVNIKAGGGSDSVSYQAQTYQETDTASTKGIKASGSILINGGSFVIDSADDSIHSNSSLALLEGSFTLSSGDDGIHGDSDVSIADGTIDILKSYEGIEGQTITVSGGTISVLADDDGFNAAGGNDQNGFYGRGGMHQDSFASDGSSYINISGGHIEIDASGDGLDSNGSLLILGGEIYISGPTNGGNGALDYNGQGEVTGGIVLAAGDGGMTENFGTSSTQGQCWYTYPRRR